MSIEKSITYFSETGKANSDLTLRLARERAEELGIKNIVVASTWGETGVKAVEIFKDYSVVVVTHVTGYRKPGEQELGEETAEKILERGGKIVTAAHVFTGGVSKAIEGRFGTVYPPGIIAQTLRIFGEGTKVCLEIVAAAADAGVIPVDQNVIAVAGTNVGADTAMVIKPENSKRIFNMVVHEIIAKPHL
jgi:hypothetical protein